jgi:dipeptidase D
MFENLEPKIVWKYFEEITKIPRPSKKEEKIIQYLLDFGKEYKLETKKDKIGNILITKKASAGSENKKTVVLQSHIDMVCEKNSDVVFDFENDSIKTKIDGEWIKAEGTTLGADNGIGIAAQLAVLASEDLEHGVIECLFTVDEETGLTGAFNLQSGFFKGKILINLDSEDEGEVFIGCAGGVDTLAKLRYSKKPVPPYSTCYKISVTGLTGGHSGDDIEKELGNSIKILTRFLWQADKEIGLRIAEFDGGNLRNAIPREAYAIVTIKDKHDEQFISLLKEFTKNIKGEFKVTEPNLAIGFEKMGIPDFVLNTKTQNRLLNSLMACPHGVIANSTVMENLVETSTNLASVKRKDTNIEITTSQRSSVESRKDYIANMVRSVFELVKADVIHTDGYPGWNPKPESEILDITKKAYVDLFGNEPIVRAIHAGLECGLFLEKFPGLDMISFGPTIKGAHSPDERIHIESTEKFWKLLLEVLKRV